MKENKLLCPWITWKEYNKTMFELELIIYSKNMFVCFPETMMKEYAQQQFAQNIGIDIKKDLQEIKQYCNKLLAEKERLLIHKHASTKR